MKKGKEERRKEERRRGKKVEWKIKLKKKETKK